MMNKKGISIFKSILFVLLIVIFVLISVFTFDYIKKSNDDNKDLKFNDDVSIRLIDSTYNPLSSIYATYLFGYKYNNFGNQSSVNTNPLGFETNSNIYVFCDRSNMSYWDNTSDNLRYKRNLYYINNEFDSFLPLAVVRDRVAELANYYNSALGPSTSYMMSFECDNIPVEDFNFSFYYNFPLTSGTNSIKMYVLTDVGCMSYTFGFSSSEQLLNFSHNEILALLPTSTKVLRFGFPILQHSNATNLTNYFPQSTTTDGLKGFNYVGNSNYYNYFRTLTESQQLNLSYLSFFNSQVNENYLQGYQDGLDDGLSQNSGAIANLNNQIASLSSTIDSLRTTISNQANIISNLQNQLNNANVGYKDLFFTFADIPFKTVYNVLNFDFFGLNLFRFFTGVLTALGCIWLIKKFI